MVTKQIIGNWQGQSNCKNVRDILLVRSQDVADEIYQPDGFLLQVKPDVKVFQFDFAYLSANWQEVELDSPNGKFFDCGFSFNIPIVSRDISKWLFDNRNASFVALWRDANNKYYRSGSRQTPLKINYQKAIGANETSFRLSGLISFPSILFYGDTWTPDGDLTYFINDTGG